MVCRGFVTPHVTLECKIVTYGHSNTFCVREKQTSSGMNNKNGQEIHYFSQCYSHGACRCSRVIKMKLFFCSCKFCTRISIPSFYFLELFIFSCQFPFFSLCLPSFSLLYYFFFYSLHHVFFFELY